MKKPNLFIVGAPKCGTTSLHNYLSLHPQCFMSRIKEPGYFSRARVRPEYRATVPYLNSLDAYLELFSDALPQQSIVGESSTSYLRDPVALDELHKFATSPRIIAVIRDPVRLISSYFQFLRFQGFEPLPTLCAAWKDQDARCGGIVDSEIVQRPDSLAYRDVAMLGCQIERLLGIFGRENVLVLLADDLQAHPEMAGRITQEFLGIELRPDIVMPKDNVARVSKIQFLDDLVKRCPAPLTRFKDKFKQKIGVHSLGIRSTLDKLNSVPAAHSIPGDLELEMREFYRADVTLLSQLIGRDLFKIWGWV